MENNATQPINPWVSMWTKPRATIQRIIDTDPDRLVLLLASAGGFAEALNRASMKNLGDQLEWPVIFGIAAIIGPIGGIFSLYLGGVVLGWTGTWLGGEATSRNIRSAIAWSSVPMIWALTLWIPKIILFGQELFTTNTPIIDSNPALFAFFLGIAAIEITVGIWASIVFLKCLGQVQGFSAWKALGNVLLTVLVIIVPIVIIVLVIAGLMR